jgi:Kef-type K+ transport system membrane component KefB
MRQSLLRLGLLLALLAVISRLQLYREVTGTPVALAAGALLLAGLFAGKVAKGVGLPRLTGYLLIGIAVGPYALRFIPGEGVAGLALLNGLAVSLIALAAGAELRVGPLRRVGRAVLRLGLIISGCVFVISTLAVVVLRPWISFLSGMGLGQAVAVAALVATVVVSFSPTVTIAIVQETKARGPFTEFLMSLVIVGDLVVMIAFALAAGVVKASFGGQLDLGGLFRGIGWELFGSLGAGALLGALTLWYVLKVGREVPLFLSAMCFASAEIGLHLHLSPLLVSLAAGALIANLHEPSGQRLHQAVERAGLPVFALFFAAAGAGLHLDALATVGPLALLLVALRAGGIYLACRRFAPPGDPRLARFLWMGLISQAGVTFGLAALVGRTFPGFGQSIEVLIVAMITVHELVGPVLTRRALARSGEVPAEGAGAPVPEKV